MVTMAVESRGEWPVNWRITSFPADARRVLQIRNAAEQYRQQYEISGPVADLEAEQAVIDSSSVCAKLHGAVNQPITFVLPTFLLRILSWLS